MEVLIIESLHMTNLTLKKVTAVEGHFGTDLNEALLTQYISN